MKIVIFGGTFSPPHMGHVSSAKAVFRRCNPDLLVIMPTGIPPHKNEWGDVTGRDRYEMCKAAFCGISDKISVSDFEIGKNGKSYTYDTVNYFKERYPSAEISLLCGEDMIMCLDTWYMAEELMKKCSFKAVLRHCDSKTAVKEKIDFLSQKYGADFEIIEAPVIDISSSEIRKAVFDGNDISDYVGADVIEIIKKRRLYEAK